MTFRNFTAETLFCINFSIHAFCRFFLKCATLHRRLLVTTAESFSLARLKLFFASTNSKKCQLWKHPRCVFAQLMLNEVESITQIARTQQIKSCSRIEVFCKHMLNTIRKATSCRCREQLKVQLVKCGRVRGSSLIAERSWRGCASIFVNFEVEPTTIDLRLC